MEQLTSKNSLGSAQLDTATPLFAGSRDRDYRDTEDLEEFGNVLAYLIFCIVPTMLVAWYGLENEWPREGLTAATTTTFFSTMLFVFVTMDSKPGSGGKLFAAERDRALGLDRFH